MEAKESNGQTKGTDCWRGRLPKSHLGRKNRIAGYHHRRSRRMVGHRKFALGMILSLGFNGTLLIAILKDSCYFRKQKEPETLRWVGLTGGMLHKDALMQWIHDGRDAHRVLLQ